MIFLRNLYPLILNVIAYVLTRCQPKSTRLPNQIINHNFMSIVQEVSDNMKKLKSP